MNEEIQKSLGQYSPPEAKRILEALESSRIEVQVAVDDGIRDVGLRGSFGQRATVEILVSERDFVAACKIRDRLVKWSV